MTKTIELTEKEVLVLRDLLCYGNAGADRYEHSARVVARVRQLASEVERENPNLHFERW